MLSEPIQELANRRAAQMAEGKKYKAIRITKDNKAGLEARYEMPLNFLEFSSGLYIISEFGDRQYQAILTKVGLNARFNIGKDLKNGFFELEQKVTA
jgi:hypothetical protein